MVGLLAGCSSSSPSTTPPTPSGRYAGIGDPYYPDDGNTGYHVRGYDVRLTYQVGGIITSATTTVHATVTARQPLFDLDLSNQLVVTSVVVNGKHATFRQRAPHELVITPDGVLTPGQALTVVVGYHGPMGQDGPLSGWHAVASGGGLLAGEPHSCAFWYPCNDYPTDKATFALTATVPKGFAVASSGFQGATTTLPSGARTFRWHEPAPTTTYLTTMLVDHLTFDRSTLPDGKPLVSAYSTGALRERANEAKLPQILALLSSKWGPYPAPTAGGMFLAAPFGFSLEVYGRPVYTAGVPLSTVVHENAHQWWGDNISIKSWKDICFNECMASYAPWLWDEAHGENLDQYYRQQIHTVDWTAPLYNMGPGHEFDGPGVYWKGAFFEHALRRLIDTKVGDAGYFAALRKIQASYGGGNMSMLEFRNVLSRLTGVDLTTFWQQWVIGREQPTQAMLFPGSLAG